MRRFKYIFLALTLGVFAQCSDYLDVNNPGEMNDVFTTYNTSESFKMLSWAYANYRANVASGGNYNFQDPIGSDAEYYSLESLNSENNLIARMRADLIKITANPNLQIQFTNLYVTLARASSTAAAIAEKAEYQADAQGSSPTEWTQLYGEAITLWGQCYFLLSKHWGDVPFGYENTYTEDYELTSRFEIRDSVISELKRVESLMYPVGKGGITAERLSRTYANALIGEIALHSGSWQTIRTDMGPKEEFYGTTFETKGTDDGKCVYARRTDYKNYLAIAVEYLSKVVNDLNVKGSVALQTTDTRASNNPFQLLWHQMNSRKIMDESIWEVGCVAGAGNSEQMYGQGRPGANGGAVARTNTYGAIRIIPSFFYNAYETGDLRRDASVVVTGTGQAGNEVILPFIIGNRTGGGGPSINKWDQNKGDNPFFPGATGNRSSGVNYTVMRMADAMLMLAEAKAVLGNDDAGAMALINQIRDRAFNGNPHTQVAGLSGEALIDRVYEERKLELLGEGDVRWDMIRSGKFNERTLQIRKEMTDLINAMKADDHYTFSNGRTISHYIWTKQTYLDGTTTFVEGVSKTGATTEATDPTNPVLFPGWRGVFHWYEADGSTNANRDKPHNLAIRGLYEYIDPAGPEAAALEADGYVKTNWGIDLTNENVIVAFDLFLMDGIKGREDKAPRYFAPLTKTIIDQSKGKVTNGYGIPQE